jgi:hypothetical protein
MECTVDITISGEAPVSRTSEKGGVDRPIREAPGDLTNHRIVILP